MMKKTTVIVAKGARVYCSGTLKREASAGTVLAINGPSAYRDATAKVRWDEYRYLNDKRVSLAIPVSQFTNSTDTPHWLLSDWNEHLRKENA
jgi:hypothetical protein